MEYCGGYHANKAWRCVLLSNAVAIGVVEAAKWGGAGSCPAMGKVPWGCVMQHNYFMLLSRR
ncbi:MAG: hypothetical protein HFH39_14145 [Lachnospiraceae bacterium]|nr:hypothetical protein [Lachnospiraceae bacterium]